MAKQKTGGAKKFSFKRFELKRNNLVIFMIAFAVVGGITLLATHAANPTVSLEAESGSITGSATMCSDSNASGTGCVQFKTATSGVNKARPFVANSPWNTTTPANTQWFDTPTLHTLTGYGANQGHWWVTKGIDIWWSSPTDPTWTFNMPNYVATGWNRNRPAQSFTVRAPANITPGTDSDHSLIVADPVTGDYVEVWEASVDSNTHTVTSNGPGWATGNAITGLGVGSLVANDGNNAGVRASNFSAIGGMLTGADWNNGVIDHAIAVALNPQILKMGAPSPYLSPATSGDAGGANIGPILMGSKIGIPLKNPDGTALTMPAALDKEIPAGSGKKPGKMLWDALQKYGMYVGDSTSGTTQFYADANQTNSTNWDPLFAWWDNNFGTSTSAMEIILPYLRVADYQPL